MNSADLYWLPEALGWSDLLAGLVTWDDVVAAARTRLSPLQTMQLDRKRARIVSEAPADLVSKPVRMAVLAACTVEHLMPALRVGGARRGLWIDTYTPDYGQYAQELIDSNSALHRFAPNTILFALDAVHLMQAVELGSTADDVTAMLKRVLDRLAAQWAAARQAFSAQIVQNVPLPVFLPLLGSNEHRLPGSRFAALRQFGELLRTRADEAGIDLIALDDRAAVDGLATWHDPALWHRAKQEIHPQAAPLYGDLVARVIAAGQGRSSKCLVLDLDNTLWGGVIGDDGLAGIKLGQGSARGEAHLAFQHYARDLGRRGIILAVCSKNDEKNALEPFTDHPEMALKRDDIACFVANWTDKATNLREIARRLNIGPVMPLASPTPAISKRSDSLPKTVSARSNTRKISHASR
jgi:predicted enzyme involved in methoxymalonyl-ACP biosynthesis